MGVFRDIDLRSALATKQKELDKKIDRYTNDEIMANDLELLCENLYEEFHIEPVVIFDEDYEARELLQKKVRVHNDFGHYFGEAGYADVDGVVFKFKYKYTGESDLFRCHASTFSFSPYHPIEIEATHIVFTYTRRITEVENESVREEIFKALQHDLEGIRQGISYCNKDVISYNQNLRGLIMQKLTTKRKKAEVFYSATKLFEIPVKKSSTAEVIIPMKKRIAPIAQKYENKQVNYCIAEKDYIEIITAIKHTAMTIERTPFSYRSMGEEDLRNVFLASLNTVFLGDATGETFRRKGKTDICIESETRAAFVAECKMWTGPKAVAPALEQLDSYLTWRDCKTALIYFVNKKDFFRTTDSMRETLKANPSIRQVEEIAKNEFKCIMLSNHEIGQIIEVRVLLFNIYTG